MAVYKMGILGARWWARACDGRQIPTAKRNIPKMHGITSFAAEQMVQVSLECDTADRLTAGAWCRESDQFTGWIS